METVLEIKDLVKTYGKSRGVDEISFSVKKGEIFGLIGPNGAGKSTIIRTIMGLIHKNSGSIKVLGLDIDTDEKEIRKNIGYLPSECNYYNEMKIIDLLKYSQKLYGNKDISIEKYAERLKMDLSKKIGDLSYGNRKKVGIVDALLSKADLFILDEATGGLDPLIQEEFFKILEELKEEGKTIIYSAHVLSEVQRLCDRVGFIKEGKLIKIEDIHNIRNIKIKKVSYNTSIKEKPELKNVNSFLRNGEEVSFSYTGEIKDLLEYLASVEVRDLTISNPSLEEIFLEYY